jgi:predicted nucleic acid-binding protein
MILLDTSGLVALFDARDGRHREARTSWARVQASAELLVMTDLVVVETVTVLRRRAGFSPAARAAERLLSPDVAEIIFVDRPLLERAIDLLARYREHDLSVTDCASFALMRERRISRAFAFDTDFRRVGFATV